MNTISPLRSTGSTPTEMPNLSSGASQAGRLTVLPVRGGIVLSNSTPAGVLGCDPSATGTGHALNPAPEALETARGLSDAPVTGTAGNHAMTARRLLDRVTQGPPLSPEEYADALQEVRQLRTAASAFPDAPALFTLMDATAAGVLFSPLTRALARSPAQAETLLDRGIRMLHATDKDSLASAVQDFEARLNALKAGSPLSVDKHRQIHEAVEMLEQLVEAKADLLEEVEQAVTAAEELEQYVRAAPTGQSVRPSMSLAEVCARFHSLRERCAATSPELPLADLFSAALRPAVDTRLARLDALSSSLRTVLCSEARTLAERALDAFPGLTDPSDMRSTRQRLTDMAFLAEGLLHPADIPLLTEALGAALHALDVGTLALEGGTLLRSSGKNLSRLREEATDFRERAEMLASGPESGPDAVAAIARAVKTVQQRLDELEAKEEAHLGHVLKKLTDLLTRNEEALQSGRDGEVRSLARQTLQFLEGTQTRLHGTLSEEGQITLSGVLSTAESHARMLLLSSAIHERTSLRVNGETMQEAWKDIESASSLAATDKAVLRELILKTSAAQLSQREEELDLLRASLKAAPLTADRVRAFKNRLDILRAHAERTLLAEHSAPFLARIGAVETEQGQSLISLVRESTATPLLAQTLKQLTPRQETVFADLCLRVWIAPPFLRVLERRLERGGPAALTKLLDAADAAGALGADAEARAGFIDMLEELTLRSPELDGISLELERWFLPPEEHARHALAHAAARGRRELGYLFAARRGFDTPVDAAFVENAVKALRNGRGDQFDLLLLRVHWQLLLANGDLDGDTQQRFAGFQQTLPEPYRTLPTPLLSALMDSGLHGRADAHAVARTLASASKALGSSARALEVFQTMCSNGERYQAEQISNTLVRNLLDAQSVTAAQALEVGGALRNAVSRELHQAPTLKTRLLDKMRAHFKQVEVLSGPFEEQVDQLMTLIPTLQDKVAVLLEREEAVSVADELLADAMAAHAENLKGVTQKGAIVPSTVPDGAPSVNPDKLKGEHLCAGLLALYDILADPDAVYGENWRETQALLSQFDFQQIFRLDEMRGFNWGEGEDNQGATLKSAFEHLKGARDDITFFSQRDAVLDVFASGNLLAKAEAVLFFKAQGRGGADMLQRALTGKHHFDPSGLCVRRMQHKYAVLRGSGARATQALAASAEHRADARKHMGRLIDAPLNKLSVHMSRTITSAVHLAVLETFIESGYDTFGDFLSQTARDRGHIEEVVNSPHFTRCLETLEGKLELPPDLARMALLSFFRKASDDTVSILTKDIGYDFPLLLRRMATNMQVHGEVKSVIAEVQAREAVSGLLSRLGAGQSATLHLETGFTVAPFVPIVGRTRFWAIAGAAKENGLCLWRGPEGKPHLTVSAGFKGTLGAAVDGILYTVGTSVQARVGKESLADLSFAEDDDLIEFLGRLFSGKAGEDTLALCESVGYGDGLVAEAGALTRVSLGGFSGLRASPGEFVGEVKAGGKKHWTRMQNGEHLTISDTVTYGLECGAQLALTGKAMLQIVVDPAIDVVAQQSQMARKYRERAHEVVERSGMTARYAVNVLKTSTRSFDAGIISGAETRRAFSLASADPRGEAQVVLKRFELSPVLLQEVLEGIESLHRSGAQCSVEVTWKLDEDALDACRTADSRTACERILAAPENFPLAEVIVHGVRTAADQNLNLNMYWQSFTRHADGTLSKDLVYRPSVV